MESNYGGIGIAKPQWISITDTLNRWSGDIWVCKNRRSGYCYAPVWCTAFTGEENSSYNYTDVNFKIKFKDHDD